MGLYNCILSAPYLFNFCGDDNQINLFHISIPAPFETTQGFTKMDFRLSGKNIDDLWHEIFQKSPHENSCGGTPCPASGHNFIFKERPFSCCGSKTSEEGTSGTSLKRAFHFSIEIYFHIHCKLPCGSFTAFKSSHRS